MWSFEHAETTTASPEAIWKRWEDVSGWPTQNPLVETSELVGPFETGSKIIMNPKKGPKSTITITEATPNKSFVGQGSIPLGKLRIEHSLQTKDGQTEFRHRIVMTGPFSKLFARFLGKNMAAVLPGMMQAIAKQAEAKSA